MRTIVELPQNQIDALKKLGKRLDLPRTELVRRAVADYLSRNRPVPDDTAFGLWKGRAEDGVHYQQRLRSEWGE
jgi:predicted transcriptional regulator